MTSRRHCSWVVGFMLAGLVAGCGNYTNEDLDFMNALPEGSDLQANLPAVTSAVELANEAELARSTHDTTSGFNGLLTALVGIVDTVRSYPPTTRAPNVRIWGPFASDPKSPTKNPGWQTRMIVSLGQVKPDQFDYEIAVHHTGVGAADTDWPDFIVGSFQAGHTARRGTGHVELRTAAVRAEGFDVSDLGMLDHLEIDYDTLDDPTQITMHVTNLPDPASADPGTQVSYAYRANAAGQGEMTFDLFANVIPGPAIEDMRVVSRWLDTGAGRASLTVIAGDGVGSRQTECWDRSFQATFNDKPWSAAEDLPQSPPGDPAAFCPVIPDL